MRIPPLETMKHQFPEGASYWQLQPLDRRLQRLKRWIFPTTFADPGSTYNGAMEFSAGVLGELEKGCFAKVAIKRSDGDGERWAMTTVRSPPYFRRSLDHYLLGFHFSPMQFGLISAPRLHSDPGPCAIYGG